MPQASAAFFLFFSNRFRVLAPPVHEAARSVPHPGAGTPARCTAVRTAMGLAVPPENDENTDGDGLGSFAVDLAAQQAAARAAAGVADTEEEQERAAAFMQRALAESARMTAACNKDQRKIERNRAAMGGALEPAIAEHAAEVLSPEHAALVAAARAAQQE